MNVKELKKKIEAYDPEIEVYLQKWGEPFPLTKDDLSLETLENKEGKEKLVFLIGEPT